MFKQLLLLSAQGSDAATTAAAETTTLVETEFAGSTVPVGTNILFGIGLVLMAAVAIAIIMYLRGHVKNWAYPMYAGAIFYLLFSYILIQLLSFLVSLIPAVKEYAAANNRMAPPWIQTAMYGVRILTDSVAIFLGLRYFRKSAPKRRINPVVGHSMSFGVACYIAYVLVSGAFTGYFQFFSIASTINSNGYASVLTSLMANDSSVTQAYLETYLNSFIHPDPWRVLFATFVNKEFWGAIPGIWPTVVMCVAYVTASVLAYEYLNKKLNVNWLLAGVGIIALMWAPYVLSTAREIPAWASGVWYLGLLAICGLILYYLFKHDLKEELEAFSYSRAAELQKEYQQTHRLPKIVMPRDEDLQPVGSAGVNTAGDSEEEQEARKAAEEAFGMTEEEAQAMMAEEAEEETEEADDLPDEDGGKEKA